MTETALKKVPSVPLLYLMNLRFDRFDRLCRAPRKFPELFTINVPGLDFKVIHHPDLVQHILVRNMQNYEKDRAYKILGLLLGNGLVTNPDYPSWRKRRTLLQPPFHREALQSMCSIVVRTTEALLDRWKAKEGSTINFTQEMAWLTIDIVSKTLFTADVSDDHIRMIWTNINYLNDLSSKMVRNPYSIPWRWPLPRYVRARKLIAQLDELIYGIIHRRKQQSDPPRDLLQLLIESRYEDGTPMSDPEIRDELMTVFVAGHETTVNALSWTWYLLKKNPACEAKLKTESALYTDRAPGFADIPALSYGSQVMNESMRMYPPVVAVGRVILESEVVQGYQMKAGGITVINIAGLHHHPDYWEQPFEFHPERFATFDIKGQNRFIYMPFGAGPRICIGNNFAMMEMQLINAMLSARVDMDLLSTDLTNDLQITLKPKGGVIMRLKKVG